MNLFFNFRTLIKRYYYSSKLYSSQKDFSQVNTSKEQLSALISKYIRESKPFIVSRFGNIELEWYFQLTIAQLNFWKRVYYYITCRTDFWRKNNNIIRHSYFHPEDYLNSLLFKQKMDNVIPEIDILGSWLKGENSHFIRLHQDVKRAKIQDLEPFFNQRPWTLELEGKKVLIVNPMVHLFIEQMKNREKLFSRPMLPDFEIVPLKALFFGDPNYPEWKDVYNYYEERIRSLDYDIAIIGCGTWGMPICSIVKSMGKGAIHLGGATQLLFGVMGKRWKDWPEYAAMVNEYWITEHKEKPSVANQIEGGCYW